ncbi:helix-turn-helix domain-containing protein [Sphingobacterium sp. UBA6320]|jgi:transcriptional regulator with XRE-family HTH domain|uniref:helix-turn-helix domain-containing protein n=1 Tax=Sphingobacterium sp. UBA6320 TaxID=1947510 RepID=UPI0025D9C3D9|nr:helix-turn-helix domain-containing protein [Sphingobacterium sp. UBA6320]
MAKTVNKELAKFISDRFNEMMKATELELEVFAAYAKIGYRNFRTYHSRTIRISVETLKKICDAYQITLTDFFNSDQALSINPKVIKHAQEFQIKYVLAKNKLLKDEGDKFVTKPIGSGNKWERDMMKYIIFHTDYFHTPRSIAEMAIDFAKDFELVLESGRIYELLRKYVDHEIKREKSTRINHDHSTSNRMIFLYKKA